MATVVNNPQPTSNNSGTLVAVVLVILAVVLFFMYGLPLVNRGVSTPQVNVPGTINVHTGK